jgi:hypothetical protein
MFLIEGPEKRLSDRVTRTVLTPGPCLRQALVAEY